MSKYSHCDLINDDYNAFTGTRLGKWLNKATSRTTIKLTIDIPKKLLYRGEYFCSDVQDLSGAPFTQNDLINFLYDDFLDHHKFNSNPKTIYNILLSIERKDLVKDAENPKFTAKDKKSVNIPLTIKLARKSALRGEIMLSDLEEAFPKHEYTLEKVLVLIYCSFIEKIKANGSEQDMKRILGYLTGDDE